MKNQLDFLKINGGLWGAINFNNMIPIQSPCLTKVGPDYRRKNKQFAPLVALKERLCAKRSVVVTTN
jgi:hypothetical protein